MLSLLFVSTRFPLFTQVYRDPSTHFAFIVGCNIYLPPAEPLTKCVRGALDVRDCLVGLGYPADNVVTCLDPGHDRLVSAFQLFANRLNGAVGATVVLFFAGYAVEGIGSTLLMPVDACMTPEAGA